MTHRMSLYIEGHHSVQHNLEMAKYAEKKGFSEVWVASGIDCIVMMSAILTSTERIKVGSAILPMWLYNVYAIAGAWKTMFNMAPHRPMVGLGAWYEPLASRVGIKRVKPLKAMKEYVESLRLLFSGEEISYEGEFIHLDHIRLLEPGKGKLDIPIHIGATGQKMHELGGQIGDGVVMNYFLTTDYIKEMTEHVRIGAESVGRKLADVDRPQLLAVAISNDRKEAIEAARYVAAHYLGYEPHIQENCGASQELLDKIHEITTWPETPEKKRAAMPLIPEDLLQRICAVGTPVECRKKVREYMDAGCTCPILSPLTDDIELLIDTFSKPL